MSEHGSRRGSFAAQAEDQGKQAAEAGREADGSHAGSSRRGSIASVRSSASKRRSGSPSRADNREGQPGEPTSMPETSDKGDMPTKDDAQDTAVTSANGSGQDEARSTRSNGSSGTTNGEGAAEASDSIAASQDQPADATPAHNASTDPDAVDGPADAGTYLASAAKEARPFSLAAPETPSESAPALPPRRTSGQADQSTGDAEWRDSTLDTVALSEGIPLSPISDSGSVVNRFQSVSFDESEAGPSRPSTTSQRDNRDSRRLSVRSEKSSSGHNYDLIAQHAHSLEAELNGNPKRKRRSEMGSADLRASFAKLRDEAEHAAAEQGSSKRASASTETDEDGQPINWDLWGEIMSDYEGMAKERRAWLSSALLKFRDRF